MTMHAVADTTTPGPATVPGALTSPRAKLVYLYLATAGGGTVDDLHAALGEPKLALHPIVDALCSRGLVECDGATYRPADASFA